MIKNKLLSLFAALACISLVALSGPARAELAAVGPLDPANGFPLWYQDKAGTYLELCMDPIETVAGPLCLRALPFPNNPVSFPDNFGAEAFWWSATSAITLPNGGDALLDMAIEAAFSLGETPAAGDQISFARMRIRVDTNAGAAGTYRVTHPYGVTDFVVDAATAGGRAINHTADVGIQVGVFTGALKGEIGPFLQCVSPAAPAGFLGDPNVPCTATGSPNNTNVFRVQRISGPVVTGGAFGTAGNPSDVIESNSFAIMGKVATKFGASLDQATYTLGRTGSGRVDVYASTAPGKTLTASAPGVAVPVQLTPGTTPLPPGKQFGRVFFQGGQVPGPVVVQNVSDAPATSSLTVQPVDIVNITRAQYVIAENASNPTGTLNVKAKSADLLNAPALTVYDGDGTTLLGAMSASGSLSMALPIPPSEIVVKSAKGGMARVKVEFVIPPVVAGPNYMLLQQ
ncbi:hypothetical protein [Fundidesulfovibrio soli]|uniref:hypothetical protein n=1 Tax=Fundidesulfovibrio soli TaxID=2922716 RepID=UPI001FAFC58A|nr:hypothetical protein [Fundidesulfovibrio soli]